LPDKTISQKLFIKERYKVLVLNAPAGYIEKMAMPSKTTPSTKLQPDADLVQVFFKSRSEMETQLAGLKKLLKPGGSLWITYPKGTSKTPADINRDSIREYAATIGLTAVSLVAIDDTWSAMRVKAG
jgi:Protein of unknown function (DUF3052)